MGVDDNFFKSELLKNCFLGAMVLGWPAGNDGNPSEKLLGFQCFSAVSHGCRLLDYWTITEKDKSEKEESFFGFTIIYAGEKPAWTMNYHGWVRKGASEIVRKALMEAYTAKQFYGGRGVPLLEYKGMRYTNTLFPNVPPGDFTKFMGHEKVVLLTNGEPSYIFADVTYQGGIKEKLDINLLRC